MRFKTILLLQQQTGNPIKSHRQNDYYIYVYTHIISRIYFAAYLSIYHLNNDITLLKLALVGVERERVDSFMR